MSTPIRHCGTWGFTTPTDDQHGERCYCGRRATRHVLYGTGCGNVCGYCARKLARRKPGTTTTIL
jgi:hypothetical protein